MCQVPFSPNIVMAGGFVYLRKERVADTLSPHAADHWSVNSAPNSSPCTFSTTLTLPQNSALEFIHLVKESLEN